MHEFRGTSSLRPRAGAGVTGADLGARTAPIRR